MIESSRCFERNDIQRHFEEKVTQHTKTEMRKEIKFGQPRLENDHRFPLIFNMNCQTKERNYSNTLPMKVNGVHQCIIDH